MARELRPIVARRIAVLDRHFWKGRETFSVGVAVRFFLGVGDFAERERASCRGAADR